VVQIIDGTTTLHVVSDGRSEIFNLSTGNVVVIPQEAWHRLESAEGVSLMTVTLQTSEFTTADNPALIET
jgi:mannose-6-phosphate isomerase-like protein (cupin superfamily)